MRYKNKPEPYLDSYGKRVYHTILEICESYDVAIDPIGGSIMAQLLSVFQRASKEANKQGISIEGENLDRQHPAVKTLLEASSKWLSYAKEYGIPTAARARIFKKIETYQLTDALDRLVIDDSHKEFESEPYAYSKKANAKSTKP